MTRKTACFLSILALVATTQAAWADPPQTDSADRLLSRGRVMHELRPALDSLGDRLEKPGKERIVLTGTLAWGKGTDEPFAVVLEYPGKLRAEMRSAGRQSILVFDGQLLNRSAELEESRALALAETLLFDTQEHLLAGQSRGCAVTCLGQNFRSSFGQEAEAPTYQLYQLWDRIPFRDSTIPKFFYLDADTLLLGSVQYTEQRGQEELGVEVNLSNWFEVDGQRLPGRIERTENRQTILVIVVESAQIQAAKADGIFRQ